MPCGFALAILFGGDVEGAADAVRLVFDLPGCLAAWLPGCLSASHRDDGIIVSVARVRTP
ncbi:hypothetical protein ACWCQQ_44830 [Streptomyces sp. NPDC002143]